ncbi:MAG: hypothetical protein K2X39_02465 [Silvanigrellaceae bacterium]|nr:hypothetical protein [Silvanigrellaceae bacterium]
MSQKIYTKEELLALKSNTTSLPEDLKVLQELGLFRFEFTTKPSCRPVYESFHNDKEDPDAPAPMVSAF